MSRDQLIHHLIWLYWHNWHCRVLWLHYYRWLLPGHPYGWYSMYVRDLIGDLPHAMQGCLVHLQHGVPYRKLYPYCP